MKFRIEREGASGGCGGCVLAIIAFNLLLGGLSVRYLVSELLHQSINWPVAVIIGAIGGEITVPAMVIVWLLRAAGVQV